MKDKRFNLASRLIHWAIAFTFLYLMLTVFLRMGWMNKGGMAATIQHGLTEKGVTVDEDTARGIAGEVRHPMWETHELAGYILIGLYIIRMLITWKQGAAFDSPFKSGNTAYQRFRSWIYVLFYIFVAGSLTTGILLEFGPHSIHEPSEEIHKLSLYYMVTFIILHICGVVIADGRKERGIISKMVSGEEPAS